MTDENKTLPEVVVKIDPRTRGMAVGTGAKGQPHSKMSFNEIVAMAADPPTVEKDDSKWVLPSDLIPGDRTKPTLLEKGVYRALVVDLDHGNLTMAEVIEKMPNVLFLVYATKSATDVPYMAENPKTGEMEEKGGGRWRVIIPFPKGLVGKRYHGVVMAFSQKLGIDFDASASRITQISYLPNRGARYEWHLHEGPFIEMQPLLEAATEAEKEKKEATSKKSKVTKAANAAARPGPWDKFNSEHSIEEMLIKYGYERDPGNAEKWRSPMQTSGSFATTNWVDKWTSMSASDEASGMGLPGSEGIWGSAWDLFVHFEHDDKPASAIRALEGLGFLAEAPCTKEGEPIWCSKTCALWFQHHPYWAGRLKFDEFLQKSMIDGRPLRDEDAINAVIWFNEQYVLEATVGMVDRVMRSVILQNRYDSLKDWFETLFWDGVPRLDTWLTRYLGVKDEPYARAVGRSWMVGGASRAMQGGCKMDYALVLEGEQGLGKSTALNTLAGDDWFLDGLPDLRNKDASMALRGKLLVEISELDAMSRHEASTVKAFVTKKIEDFRPTYGRENVQEPRRCIFAGTTNKGDWMNDPTGGRRWWPVTVGVVDIPALARDREQLWAEAAEAVAKGEQPMLSFEMSSEQKEQVKARRNVDPWLDSVRSFLVGKEHVNAKTVLNGIGITRAVEQTNNVCTRISGILQSLGWVRDGKYHGGTLKFVPGPNAELNTVKDFEDEGFEPLDD